MDWEARRNELADRLAERERIDDERVIDAIRTVPRHEFVPDSQRQNAYSDRPLPIGQGQTISAPHMVAIMADILELQEGDRVLEIGTGCGYHAAVTAEIVGAAALYTVEYHDELATNAREWLDELGYEDVSIRVGDGRDGWPENAPYDQAYFTCAPGDFPDNVVEQVRPGGQLLAPLGRRTQSLVSARRQADGQLERETYGGVRFVEMQ